jgi:hypothetical protein
MRSCSQPSASKSNVLEKPGEPFLLCSIIENEPMNALFSKCIPKSQELADIQIKAKEDGESICQV